MNILISWSGERSNKIATALNNWIPKVIQVARPWMSTEDISTGSRWGAELNKILENTTIGVICVTPENQQSIWLHFEAGALSKSISESKVMPILLEMSPGQLFGPMSQFQAVTCSKEGVGKIIHSINESLGESGIKETDLSEIYDVWWPKLESELAKIGPYCEIIPKRGNDEMLEEVLDILREQRRKQEERLERIESKKEDVQKMFEAMQSVISNIEESSKENANLEKLKLAFLANSKDKRTGKEGIVPKELLELIDKQEGSSYMKDLLGMLGNLQQTLISSILEENKEGDDKNEA